MTKAIEVLRAHKSAEPSKWREQAQWNVNNWGWIKHSAKTALRARSRMEALGLTQKDLAERMACSQQYISLILKGKENLTLETIAKLEKALDTDILLHPSDCVDGYDSLTKLPNTFLSAPDDERPEYGEDRYAEGKAKGKAEERQRITEVLRSAGVSEEIISKL